MIGNGTETSFIEQDTNNSIIGCDKNNNDGSGAETVHTRGNYLLDLIKKFEVLSLPDTSYVSFKKDKKSQNVKKHDNNCDGCSKQLQTFKNEDTYHQDGETSTKLLTMNTSLRDDYQDMKGDNESIYIDKLYIAFKSDIPDEDMIEHVVSLEIDANPTLSTINSEDQNVRPNRLIIVTFDLSKTDYIYYDKDPESSDECDYLAFPEIADKSNDENISSTINETILEDKEPVVFPEVSTNFNNNISSSITNENMIDNKEPDNIIEVDNIYDNLELFSKYINSLDDRMIEQDLIYNTETIHTNVNKGSDINKKDEPNNLNKIVLYQVINDDNSSNLNDTLVQGSNEIVTNTDKHVIIIKTDTDHTGFELTEELIGFVRDFLSDDHDKAMQSIHDRVNIDELISEALAQSTQSIHCEKLRDKYDNIIQELIDKSDQVHDNQIHEVQVQTPPKIVHMVTLFT